MGSSNCTGNEDYLQEKLDAPMPWIGMYIAAASAACSLAMGADVVDGFRMKKLWFPSKYFSLNAFSLTVLAVAMKLPLDLTSKMTGSDDKHARVSSMYLMSTAMSHFMVSLGSMGNNEIMLNLAALCILVITIAGNVCIQINQIRYDNNANLTSHEEIGSTVLMLFLLVILCSSALMVSTANRCIESQYKQMHKRILNERVNQIGIFTTDSLRTAVKRYWVMAESGNPQFVLAGSVTCVTAGALRLILAQIMLITYGSTQFFGSNSSNYKWSTTWILYIQSIGVTLGSIAPLLRWFTGAQFKSKMIGKKSLKDEFKVEAYWTQSLRQWRDSPSLLIKTRHHKLSKTLHDAKRLFLNFCIGVQILIVWASKLVLLLSANTVEGLMVCFKIIKNFMACYSKESEDTRDFESRTVLEMDFSCYVPRLEGEAEIPKRTLRNMCNEVDKLIRMGKKKQSKNLIKLLQKSVNFNGVREFDHRETQSLNSQLEPPNCWSLPVVSLMSIAISLPNITDSKSKQLIAAVSEGLNFVRLIDKCLDVNGELENIRNAADVVWVGVKIYKKWLDNDLQGAGWTHKETLQKLSDIAENNVAYFTTHTNNFLVRDPLNWPAKVIAANSMYQITQTILSAHNDHDHPQREEGLFERLSVMISDILAACLTNLARVIILKCYSSDIKEREKNIRQAAVLLGESEEVLETLGRREVPNMDPEKAATIEGWRAFFMEQGNENPVSSVSPTFPQTLDGHDSVELDH